MLSRKLLFRASGALVVVLVLAGAATWLYLHNREKADYRIARVQRGVIESAISATGTCNAVVTVQVGSQVSGNIKALYADFNTKVRKGQLVALIDPEIFQARANQAQANLDAARASVVSAQAQVQKAEADQAGTTANLANLKAGIAKAKVATLDAKTKLQHRLALFAEGIVSAEDRDTAQAAYDSALAAREAAEAMYSAGQETLKAAQAQLDVARTMRASAEAQVRQSTAALGQANVDLEHTRILAPVDGTVVARRMDTGQTVAASFQAPTIFEVAQDLTKMQVDTSVDEADIGKVRTGQPATFSVDAYPARVLAGSVAQIRQAPINVQNVITYDVVVAVDNPDLRLFPGMTANVRILSERRENVLKVPNSALRVKLGPPAGDSESAFVRTVSAAARQAPAAPAGAVYVLAADGKPKPVRVQLGISDGRFTEVNGDLSTGDSVIVGVSEKKQPAPAATGGPRRGPGF